MQLVIYLYVFYKNESQDSIKINSGFAPNEFFNLFIRIFNQYNVIKSIYVRNPHFGLTHWEHLKQRLFTQYGHCIIKQMSPADMTWFGLNAALFSDPE